MGDNINKIIFLLATTIITILGFGNGIAAGWHANLGITDQQAKQLYKTNPDDPKSHLGKMECSKKLAT
jgi:hypothetical protein